MECFIKKIFNGKRDSWTHVQFQRFSRGEFKDRAILVIKNLNGKYSISSTPEYANEMVFSLAEKNRNDKIKVNGSIFSTKDLKNELNFSSLKQFMGIKQYKIDNEMTGNQILEVCEKYPKSFIAFSFKTKNDELKIKDKAPKSAKPSNKAEEAPKIDFCKLKTSDKKLVEDFVFDDEIKENWKKIEIKHDFLITDIIIPDELKNEKDFAKIRENADRKGKIVREIDIDGKKIRKEIDFQT